VWKLEVERPFVVDDAAAGDRAVVVPEGATVLAPRTVLGSDESFEILRSQRAPEVKGTLRTVGKILALEDSVRAIGYARAPGDGASDVYRSTHRSPRIAVARRDPQGALLLSTIDDASSASQTAPAALLLLGIAIVALGVYLLAR